MACRRLDLINTKSYRALDAASVVTQTDVKKFALFLRAGCVQFGRISLANVWEKGGFKMLYGVDRMRHGVEAKQSKVYRRRGAWSVRRKNGAATVCRSAGTDSGGAPDGGSGGERRDGGP